MNSVNEYSANWAPTCSVDLVRCMTKDGVRLEKASEQKVLGDDSWSKMDSRRAINDSQGNERSERNSCMSTKKLPQTKFVQDVMISYHFGNILSSMR